MGMFSFFKKLFTKLWNSIRRVLAILLVIAAVLLLLAVCFMSAGTMLVVFGVALTAMEAVIVACVALTCAFVLDHKAAASAVGHVGEAVEEVVKAAASAAGGVVSAGIGAFLSNPGVMLVGVAIVAYFLLKDGKDDNSTNDARATGVAT